ncbi:hypothetical protein AB0J86_01710 [Micromonospora sp. NPDC049559]|uniref:hypothetical protein n=1 Tax=Micromonospora sp. NPDC049559 TaxID=3155923 RepID=UPI0034487C4F
MSYPGNPAPGGTPPVPIRRAPVVAAVGLLGLMAAVGLGHAVAVLASLDGIVTRFRQAAEADGAERSDIDGVVDALRGGLIAASVVAVAVAGLLLVLAAGDWRGRRNARVATWVVCLLGLLCGCWGLALIVVQRAVEWPTGADPTAPQLLAALTESYPSWWVPLGAGLSAAQALGYLVVAVLLALPGANEFFNRSPAGPRMFTGQDQYPTAGVPPS